MPVCGDGSCSRRMCTAGVVLASVCVFESCVGVCQLCVVAHTHSLVCEVRKEKSGVPQHASASSSSICPFPSVLHKLKMLYICIHC